jgi:uncharacterized protein YjiS (DUF1127 family)
MICMSCTQPAEEAGRSARSLTLTARAGALIRLAWRDYWDWRARKATILILQSLDCRTLHDIGITPGEIESLVCGGNDRCRCYDATWLAIRPR